MSEPLGMHNILTDPIFAGAIFTPEEVRMILIVVVVIGVLALVALGLFIRSAYRLVTKDQPAKSDVVIVALGLLLLVPPILGQVQNSVEDIRRQNQALALIEDSTEFSTRDFGDGYENWTQNGCQAFTVRVDEGMPIRRASPEPSNDGVRRDATAFANQGWTVTRYAPDDAEDGLAFVAIREETQVVAHLGTESVRTAYGSLTYVISDIGCGRAVEEVERDHFVVASFGSN